MPYDPNFPTPNTLADAVQVRGQFAGLKDIIDLLAANNVTAVVIDAVNTVPAGSPANVTASVAGNVLHLTFDLPQGTTGADGTPGPQGSSGADGAPGQQGADGAPGEVTNAALAAAIAGTSSNTNAVPTLDTPFANDPPTLADLEVMRAAYNALVLAARR